MSLVTTGLWALTKRARSLSSRRTGANWSDPKSVKIEADKDNRAIRDGEIQTACQQACPAQAITFGNINDKSSRVAKQRSDERTYQVLADQNTRPRTTYIAAVLNPNGELEEKPIEHG